MTSSSEPELAVRHAGETAVLILNRPRTLNALSEDMLSELERHFAVLADDPGITRIVLRSGEGRAFSAGADVRAMHAHVTAGKPELAAAYFAREYALDGILARYSKPVFALVEGVCFGAGMGLAMHSRYCVASETAHFAMPETAIGFFPDAGATYFLNTLPQALALYLALTGFRLTARDAASLGLVSHLVPSHALDAVEARIIAEGEKGLPPSPEPVALSFHDTLGQVEDCFGADSYEGVLERLKSGSSNWARTTLAVLEKMSPTALEASFEIFRRNRGRSLEACLEREEALMAQMMAHPDFAEGVRAMLVDKDRAPRWQLKSDVLAPVAAPSSSI